MRRKLVKQGRNALTVTLPASWTKKFNLKAGDEIEVEEVGKGITVGTEKSTGVNKTEFDTTKIKDFRNQYLSYFYHKGFDEVRIVYDDPKVLSVTREKIGELMGYEIVENGKNYFIIRNISESLESEFDIVLRRLFIMLKSMSEECLGAIKEGQFTRLKDIKNQEKTNNKFTDFCIRILNKKGYKEYNKTMPLYIIVRELEKIADIYKYIGNHLSESDPNTRISEETIRFFEETNGYLKLFYDLFYRYDEEKIKELFEIRSILLKEGYTLIKDKEKEETILLHHLINLVNQIFELKGPYFEMNIH